MKRKDYHIWEINSQKTKNKSKKKWETSKCNIFVNCRDQNDIEKNLKRKFEDHQHEKERIMDEIEDYSEEVKKYKDISKNYEN